MLFCDVIDVNNHVQPTDMVLGVPKIVNVTMAPPVCPQMAGVLAAQVKHHVICYNGKSDEI